MRFLATILIATALLGSVAGLQHAVTRRVRFDVTREAHAAGEHVDTSDVAHTYRIELTPTFAAADDPFAVQVDATNTPPRLQVRYEGRVLLEHREDIRRGETITVPDLRFDAARVSLYVEASPTSEDAARPCALRVRIYRDDGALCTDATLWSEGDGAQLAGTIDTDLAPIRVSVDRGLGDSAP